MKFKPIIIVPGDPLSVFIEIFLKSHSQKYRSPIILIYCKKDLNYQIKKLKFKKKIRLINPNNLNLKKLNNIKINLIDVKLKDKNKSSLYFKNCFDIAIKLIKNGFSHKFINGPIDKKKILNKKFMGVTEFVAEKFKQKKFAMLLFNKKLSVCPITTHLPLKTVAKKINQKIIISKIKIIDEFYKTFFKIKPRIGITGLNPHCESIFKSNEDSSIVLPSIKKIIKKKINIKGPFSADTIFLKQNRKKYDVIVGMYHDQVIGPFKTLFEYDAINITIGLPFLRVSPDHGPNIKMIGKNKSNPQSLIRCLEFLDKK